MVFILPLDESSLRSVLPHTYGCPFPPFRFLYTGMASRERMPIAAQEVEEVHRKRKTKEATAQGE